MISFIQITVNKHAVIKECQNKACRNKKQTIDWVNNKADYSNDSKSPHPFPAHPSASLRHHGEILLDHDWQGHRFEQTTADVWTVGCDFWMQEKNAYDKIKIS